MAILASMKANNNIGVISSNNGENGRNINQWHRSVMKRKGVMTAIAAASFNEK
jgi:hypothetical protein